MEGHAMMGPRGECPLAKMEGIPCNVIRRDRRIVSSPDAM